MYFALLLCIVSLYYVLYHCIMRCIIVLCSPSKMYCAVSCIVQDVLCLCGALAGADNGFPRLTWRAAALLIRLALIIVIIVDIVIIVLF